MRVKERFNRLMDYLFPPHCIFCDKVISAGKKVCDKCSQEIKPINSVKRINLKECGQTISCVIPYPYQDHVRNSIIQFKFHGKKQFAVYYAKIMVEEIVKSFSTLHIDIVTCVPISKQRMKIRGYNQSELIAKELVKLLNLSYQSLLIKGTDNKEQHKLSMRERQKNVKGVYEVINPDKIVGKTILLIDDIVTTGATISECAKVLFGANAKEVICAAVAQVVF
ncbi:MAG TPA: ComF family protein [Oscillospiraceae bacterium]|nr:ComF family protein [Oscillospiraceae bacterium]